MVILLIALGFRSGLSIMKKYPAMIVLPAFTFITMGPIGIKSDFKTYFINRNQRRIGVSYWHTLVNILMTICGTIGAYFYIYINYAEQFFYSAHYSILQNGTRGPVCRNQNWKSCLDGFCIFESVDICKYGACLTMDGKWTNCNKTEDWYYDYEQGLKDHNNDFKPLFFHFLYIVVGLLIFCLFLFMMIFIIDRYNKCCCQSYKSNFPWIERSYLCLDDHGHAYVLANNTNTSYECSSMARFKVIKDSEHVEPEYVTTFETRC